MLSPAPTLPVAHQLSGDLEASEKSHTATTAEPKGLDREKGKCSFTSSLDSTHPSQPMSLSLEDFITKSGVSVLQDITPTGRSPYSPSSCNYCLAFGAVVFDQDKVVELALGTLGELRSRSNCQYCDALRQYLDSRYVAWELPVESELRIKRGNSHDPFATLQCGRLDLKIKRPNRRDFLHHLKKDTQLIKEWLCTCAANHGKACNEGGGHYLSNYLTSINLVDVELECLVTKPVDEQTKYVALSYVWGTVPMYKARKCDRELLQRSGAFSGAHEDIPIPKTIRDAMTLTRDIGQRYLWIDCLCIWQDDDSLGESLRAMAAIYAAAELTIVAAGGNGADYGLIVGAQCDLTQPWSAVPLRLRNSFLPVPQGHVIVDAGLEAYAPGSSWASRGWTFQESLFSRRLLILDGVVSWVCDRSQWVQGFEDGVEPRTLTIPDGGDATIGIPVGMLGRKPRFPSLRMWGPLVEEYSSRNFTFQTDVARAFAGATEIMKDTFPAGLLWGLPEFFFDIAVLWEPVPGGKFSTREGKDFATGEKFPSWSWMGWAGGVDCLNPWTPYIAGIFEERVTEEDWPPFATLQPTATWCRTACSGAQKEALRNDFVEYQVIADPLWQGPLPRDWTCRNHEGSVYFTNCNWPEADFGYPIPAPDREDSEDMDHVVSPILECTAPRTTVRIGNVVADYRTTHTVEILDSSEKAIGALLLYEAVDTTSQPSRSCELIAVSQGKVTDRTGLDSQRNLSWAHPELWDIDSWVPDSSEEEVVDRFCNVLCIEWEDGVAYRRGSGRVNKLAWDQLNPEVVSIELG